MQNVAREMNLSDTACLQRSTDGFDLRWFTPSVEVDLCGHATLASAHILSCDESGEVVIVVRDPGAGFDPGAIADPLDSANIRKPSGRGIFLINELMDHVQFPARWARDPDAEKEGTGPHAHIKVNVGCQGRSLCMLDDCEVDVIVMAFARRLRCLSEAHR